MLDAIDLTHAIIGAPDCPDVRSWPIGDQLLSVEFADHERFERGDTMVEFHRRDSLPAANGTQGAISYTIWIGCLISGTWYLAAAVECIGGYVPTGPFLAPGQIGSNILYYVAAPLLHYQPQPGERILLFCTTGDTRRQNAQALSMPAPWRTNAVIVPLAVGRYDVRGEPVSTPPPLPPPVTPPPPPPATPVSYDEILRRLSEFEAQMQDRFDQLDRRLAVLASQPIPQIEIPPFPTYTGSLFGARIRLVPEQK